VDKIGIPTPVHRGALMDDSTLIPTPGITDERAEFRQLQARLPGLFRRVFGDRSAPRTVVVCPGLSLDPEVLCKVAGARHYEERMLSMLMLLRLPNTRVIFLTSEPIAPVVIDYYLSLLSGIPASHARARLVLLSTHDASPVSLTRKILDRPRLLARIRHAIGDRATAHLSVFNAAADEVSLAVALGIPMYACDPALEYWGGKSGSRHAFREAGIALPDGAEDLLDLDQAATALQALLARKPGLRRAVLKLNQGFSGEGNAVVDLAGLDAASGVDAVRSALDTRLTPEAPGITVQAYEALFRRHGGIVEAWIEGEHKRTPSVQLRINPLGDIELISSHEQVMGGRSGQIFQGSTFPADPAYALDLHAAALRVAAVLRDKGVLGRFSIDFVSVDAGGCWEHHAIEINLRKGGTTLPYQMLQFLTDGRYCSDSARFITPMGQPRCYYATDNLVNPDYRRLLPQDLIDILVAHRLQFDETLQQGLVFNLIGALSEFGKLGLLCIADTPQAAAFQFQQAKALLDREAAASGD
jgi:hypothetical protein